MYVPNEKRTKAQAYRDALRLCKPGIDGIAPAARTLQERETLAATLGNERRRAAKVAARERGKRVASGHGSVDDVRWSAR